VLLLEESVWSSPATSVCFLCHSSVSRLDPYWGGVGDKGRNILSAVVVTFSLALSTVDLEESGLSFSLALSVKDLRKVSDIVKFVVWECVWVVDVKDVDVEGVV